MLNLYIVYTGFGKNVNIYNSMVKTYKKIIIYFTIYGL